MPSDDHEPIQPGLREIATVLKSLQRLEFGLSTRIGQNPHASLIAVRCAMRGIVKDALGRFVSQMTDLGYGDVQGLPPAFHEEFLDLQRRMRERVRNRPPPRPKGKEKKMAAGPPQSTLPVKKKPGPKPKPKAPPQAQAHAPRALHLGFD